jgi:hypothetical protein
MVLLPAYANAITPPGSTAEAQVNGSVAKVRDRTKVVFSKMGIHPSASSVEKSGAEQMLQGKKGDLDVEVKLEKVEQAQNQTKVEVVAKQNAVKWNNDYAKKVLENIIASG